MKWKYLLLLVAPVYAFIPLIDKVHNTIQHHRETIHQNTKKHNQAVGYMIVKAISSLLPHVDTIGHRVLHADNEFIHYILNMDDAKIPHKWKTRIILFSIRMAQKGDEAGSHMLQWYYDIVQNCFKE